MSLLQDAADLERHQAGPYRHSRHIGPLALYRVAMRVSHWRAGIRYVLVVLTTGQYDGYHEGHYYPANYGGLMKAGIHGRCYLLPARLRS